MLIMLYFLILVSALIYAQWTDENLLRRIMGPDKLLSGAEALVPQSHGRVDDVLSVSANHHEPGNTVRKLKPADHEQILGVGNLALEGLTALRHTQIKT